MLNKLTKTFSTHHLPEFVFSVFLESTWKPQRPRISLTCCLILLSVFSVIVSGIDISLSAYWNSEGHTLTHESVLSKPSINSFLFLLLSKIETFSFLTFKKNPCLYINILLHMYDLFLFLMHMHFYMDMHVGRVRLYCICPCRFSGWHQVSSSSNLHFIFTFKMLLQL